jgi:hypothetical protein
MSSTNTNAPVAEKKRGAERTQKAVRDEGLVRRATRWISRHSATG